MIKEKPKYYNKKGERVDKPGKTSYEVRMHSDDVYGGELDPVVINSGPIVKEEQEDRIESIAQEVMKGNLNRYWKLPQSDKDYVDSIVKEWDYNESQKYAKNLMNRAAINHPFASGFANAIAFGGLGGPAGAASSLLGGAVNMVTNAATDGKKRSWGDLFTNQEEHPILHFVLDATNPGYLAAGPLTKAVTPQYTSVASRAHINGANNVLNDAILNFDRKIPKYINNSVVDKNILAGKVGWAPSYKRTLWHASDNADLKTLDYKFPAWDISERNAPLGHVWMSGTDTKAGFLGKRSYHYKGVVDVKKPMVQLNEAIGDGKNATRNDILKFADQSGADAIQFSNIADNTLPSQDVHAIFKNINIKPKLTEAERLGVPRGERNNVISKSSSAFKDEIIELVPRYNKFAQFYGYKKVSPKYNYKRAADVIKKQLARHNTFYRGLIYPVPEDEAIIKNIIGKDATIEQVFEYMAKNGAAVPSDTYFSPLGNASMYGNDVAIVRRNYKLGKHPKNWLQEADFDFDFTPATKSAPKGKVNYPWFGETISTLQPNEVRINPEDYTFLRFLPKRGNTYDGTFEPYPSINQFAGSKNKVFNADRVLKPSFKSGGEIENFPKA